MSQLRLHFEFGSLVFQQFLLPQPKNRSRADATTMPTAEKNNNFYTKVYQIDESRRLNQIVFLCCQCHHPHCHYHPVISLQYIEHILVY